MRFLKTLLGSKGTKEKVQLVLVMARHAALYLLEPYTGVAMPVNRLSLLAAAALGVPGVTLLVLLDML